MTVTAFLHTPTYLVSGIGPYEISHPYKAGAIVAYVVVDGAPVALDAEQLSISPEESQSLGNLYISAELAAAHDGRALWIDRTTDPVQGWEARYGDREVGMEGQLDRDTMVLQELRAGISAALRGRSPVPPYDPTPGHVPVFRDDGTGWADGPSQDELYASKTYAEIAQQSASAAAEYLNSILGYSWVTQAFEFVATAGQTVFSGPDAAGRTLAVSAAPIVIHEGSVLQPSAYVVSAGGGAVTLSYAAQAGDVVAVYATAGVPAADFGLVRTLTSRAQLVLLNGLGMFAGYVDGAEVRAGGLAYRRRAASTMIPGLSGWDPVDPTYGHFGAVGDGIADDTTAIQAAVDAGIWIDGTVAKHRLTGRITGRVLLRGAGYDFPAMNVSSMDDLTGTVFVTALTSADVDRVFDLERGSVLQDVLIYHTGQAATRPADWVPVTTPWAIGVGSVAENAYPARDQRVTIQSVMVLEFTHGLILRKGAEQGLIDRFNSNAFTRHIDGDACYDLVRIIDSHRWPFGGNTGAAQVNERIWTQNNLVAYRFGRVDGLILSRSFSIFDSVSFELYPSESGDGLNATATTNFHVSDCYFDGSNCNVWVHGAYATGWKPSGHFVGCTMLHWWDVTGAAGIGYTGGNLENVIVESDIKEITFEACRLQASGNYRQGGTARIAAASGVLKFVGCQIGLWDQLVAGVPCFVASGAAARIIVSAPSFWTAQNTPLSALSGRVLFSGLVEIYDFGVEFLPQLTCTTHGDLVLSDVSARVGLVQFMGRFAAVQIRISGTTTHTTASGAVRISGLPWVVQAASEAPAFTSNIRLGAFIGTALQAAPGGSVLAMIKESSGAGSGPVQIVDFTSGERFSVLLSGLLRV